MDGFEQLASDPADPRPAPLGLGGALPVEACRICGSPTRAVFEAEVLGKHKVSYFRCETCGFMQTERPYWLAEAYAETINDIDLGVLNRAVTSAPIAEDVILTHLDPRGKFLDYGAGYGVFVRLMRDRGYDFYWSDAYCQNLFAQHFVGDPQTEYELVTAFEVFEHLEDPVAQIGQILAKGRNVFFSTLLAPPNVSRAEDWWYFGPEHGQHISFYTREALARLAERFGKHLVSDGDLYHMLTARPIPEAQFRRFTRGGYRATLARKLRRRRQHMGSLLHSDFHKVSGWSLERG